MFWTWSLSQSWEASTSLFQNFVRSSRHPLVPPYSVGRISVEFYNCGTCHLHKKDIISSTMMTEIQKVKNRLKKRGLHLCQDRPPGHCNHPELIRIILSNNFKLTWGCNETIFYRFSPRNIGSDAYLGVNHLASLHLLRLESFHQVYHCVHNTRPKKMQSGTTKKFMGNISSLSFPLLSHEL